MHAAPPVRMSLTVDVGWRVFLIIACTAAAANVSAWIALLLQQSAPVVGVVCLSCALIAAVGASRVLKRHDDFPQVLGWDGATWRLTRSSSPSGDPAEGDLRIMIDLGSWILLRFQPSKRSLAVSWLPLSRSKGGAAWPHWRAALYARREGPTSAAVDPS